MSRFKYPVDTDQFQEIREQGKLYVDKTDMVYNLVNEYKYVFLARPRRFGKSLLCNTFKAYFKGQKELFDACPESEFMVSSSNQRGLKVMELEKEWKTYPVLQFIMSGLKNCTISDAKIPYDIITKEDWEDKEKRESFYKLLIYMVFSLLNSIVDTEVKSILGRADVVIKTDTDIFVLELKVDDSVENALAQIDSKGYAIPYEADASHSTGSGQAGSAQVSRTVTKCGVSISSEQRNITHWRSVDVDGNVIDEQKFQ